MKADPSGLCKLFDEDAFHDISNLVKIADTHHQVGACADCVVRDLEKGHVGFYIELWGGSSRITRCWGDLGLPVLGAVDILKGGQMMDLTGPGQGALRRLTGCGLIEFAMCEPTCTTFCRFRSLFGTGTRTEANPEGELLDESVGNQEMVFVSWLCKTLHRQGRRFAIENSAAALSLE